jgi:signal transduction histidine kinase
MRVALKLVLVFLLANSLLAALYGYLTVRQEVRSFEQRASEESESLGSAMQGFLAEAWQKAGSAGLEQYVHKAEFRDAQLRLRWVWFDRQTDGTHAPAMPLARLTSITLEQHQALEDVDPTGTPRLFIYWPVQLKDDRRGGLEFAYPLAELEAKKRDIIIRIALLVGGMALMSGCLATLLGVRYIGEPLRKLRDKTRRIAAGDLGDPIHINSHDELAELAESLNQMCARLAESQTKIQQETAARIAALEQLRHSDRLQTIGRLASGIAHELGTPLNVVSGRAELIASGKLPGDEIGRSAVAIKTEAERMTRIIRQLLDFARASAPRKAPLDLGQLVGQTVDLLRPLADKHDVQLDFKSPGSPAVAQVDAAQMQQVLSNLVVNAIQAQPTGGRVELAVRSQQAVSPQLPDRGMQQCAAIEVRDQGVGIPPEHLPHIFEPFFSTKEVGEGTGLGLSIAYGIVQEHGGWIDVSSRPGEGSCFTIYLPLEKAEG